MSNTIPNFNTMNKDELTTDTSGEVPFTIHEDVPAVDVYSDMQQVTAFAGFAIYVSFDGMAPDSEDLLLVSRRDVAEQVVVFLNKDPKAWGCLAAIDGFEDFKSFCVKEALRRSDEEFQTDFDEICDQVRALAEDEAC